MATREEIGRRIRQAREELRLSQTDLGRMMSRQRSHAAISDLERGNVRLDVEELVELTRLLQKDLQYFYEGEGGRAVVYRRGDYGLSPDQQRETDQALDAFKKFAREQAGRNASR
jgi:transcriptional regulator with XRE-family HTH domain